MHLNHCALVSSFLFAPIVLADYYLEKPRRLLNNNLKQNINAASNEYIPWAGGYLPDSKEDYPTMYISATGLFVVPFPWGANGNSFGISVSIGSMCRYSDGYTILAGIGVHLNDSVVSYTAHLQWGDVVRPQTNITIDAGDIIRATVNTYSYTTGSAVLENLSKGQKWEEPFDEDSAICQQTAEWVVAAFPGFSVEPVPMFDLVFFWNASVEMPGGAMPGRGVTVGNMEYNNMTFLTGTSVDDESSICVEYTSSTPLDDLEDNLEDLSLLG